MQAKALRPRKTVTAVERAHELIRWLFPVVSKFPRDFKFTIGDHLQQGCLTVLRNLVRATYSREKVAYLDEANQELEVVRHLVRLSRELELLPEKHYEQASKLLYNVGVEIGGWAKDQRKREAPG